MVLGRVEVYCVVVRFATGARWEFVSCVGRCIVLLLDLPRVLDGSL